MIIVLKWYQMSKQTNILILETQNYCSLALENKQCKHCSVDDYVSGDNSISEVDWENVISQFSEMGGEKVVLKNGAGALGDEEISVLEKALESDMDVSVTTEGVLVSERFEERLYELSKEYNGKVGVTVSLEGENKEVYGQLRMPEHFDKAISFIRQTKDNGLHVATNMVVHDENVDHIQDYIQFVVQELGVDKINFLELNPTGNALRNNLKVAKPEKYLMALVSAYGSGDEEIRSAMNDTFAAAIYNGKGCRGCDAGLNKIYVNHNGDIFPCTSMEYKGYTPGNVKDVKLIDAIGSAEFKDARKDTERMSDHSISVMCPGRFRSFSKLSNENSALELTKKITQYLTENKIDTKNEPDRCYSPAF